MAKLYISNKKLLKAKFRQLKSLFIKEEPIITKSIHTQQGFLRKKILKLFFNSSLPKYSYGQNYLVFPRGGSGKENCLHINKKLTFFVISILIFCFYIYIILNEENYQLDKLSKKKTIQEDQLLLNLYNEVDCYQKWKFISENFKKKGFIKN